MLTQELIDRGGSKLETTRLIVEQDLLPVPDSVWKYYGDPLDPLFSRVQAMLKRGLVIVRGSHSSDYHWSIDAVDTVRNVDSISALEQAIKVIEGGVSSNDFKNSLQRWRRSIL